MGRAQGSVGGLAALLVACASPPAAPAGSPTDPLAVPSAGRASPPVALAVESAPVAAAVRELSRASGLALVIDPAAERYAACAHVSLTTPTPRPADELVTLLGAALGGSGFTLTARPEGLWLSHDGRTRPVGCSRAVVDLAALGAPGITAGPGLDAPLDPAVVPPDASTSVRAVSDTEFEITRAYRDAFLADPSAPMRAARVIPHEVDGEAVGVRLFGIRRASFLGTLGFQNGDVVRELNGHRLADPESALEAYTALRVVDRYEILLDRRGETRTHVVRIVDALGESGVD